MMPQVREMIGLRITFVWENWPETEEGIDAVDRAEDQLEPEAFLQDRSEGCVVRVLEWRTIYFSIR